MVDIRIFELSHEYDNREVIASLNFAFSGACLAITGPNGSGKSTLMRIIAGLLTPTGGEVVVSVDGAPISRDNLRDIIGITAPDIKLYTELTPRENLRFILSARGCKDESRIYRVLEEVGLIHRADDSVYELSSGLRQRAAIAAALVCEPKLLLLDEPSSNLDADGLDMLRSVMEVQKLRGMVIIATNDPDEVKYASQSLDLGTV